MNLALLVFVLAKWAKHSKTKIGSSTTPSVQPSLSVRDLLNPEMWEQQWRNHGN